MRILLTGGSGQIGRELIVPIQSFGETIVPDRSQLDLSQETELRDYLRAANPNLIIDAAYTDVDGAQDDRQTAFAINARAPELMSQWASENDTSIVHFSTDYVYAGTGEEPWTEDDPCDPVNFYGDSKLAGDLAVLHSGAPCLVLRTSWIYSQHGKNFFRTMLRLSQERDRIQVVDDQFGAPTAAAGIADLVIGILSKAAGNFSPFFRANGGLVNATASGETNWHGFAQRIIEMATERGYPVKALTVEAIPSSEYPLPAPRPRNSRLSLTRLSERFGIVPPHWQDGLAAVFDGVDRLPTTRLEP